MWLLMYIDEKSIWTHNGDAGETSDLYGKAGKQYEKNILGL